MFRKILIANRGDCRAAAAAQPKCRAREACAGEFAAGDPHV
jgi:hypothetical protein